MQRIISSTDSNDLLKLLEYLSDPRWAVQLAVLRDLYRLAVHAPHIWSEKSINELFNVKNPAYQDLIVWILIELCKSQSLYYIFIKLGISVRILKLFPVLQNLFLKSKL